MRVLTVDEDAAGVRFEEPVDHAQRRGLATSGRTDEHACLAVGNVQRKVTHRVGAAGKSLADVFQPDHGVVYRNRMPAGAFLDYVDPWVNWTWLSNHVPLFIDAMQQHLTLTAIAVPAGLRIPSPVVIPAHPLRTLRNPLLGFFGV